MRVKRGCIQVRKMHLQDRERVTHREDCNTYGNAAQTRLLLIVTVDDSPELHEGAHRKERRQSRGQQQTRLLRKPWLLKLFRRSECSNIWRSNTAISIRRSPAVPLCALDAVRCAQSMAL